MVSGGRGLRQIQPEVMIKQERKEEEGEEREEKPKEVPKRVSQEEEPAGEELSGGKQQKKQRTFVSPPREAVHLLMQSCSTYLCGSMLPSTIREGGLSGLLEALKAVAPKDVGLPCNVAELGEGGSRNVSIYCGEQLSVEIIVLNAGDGPIVLEMHDAVVAVCR